MERAGRANKGRRVVALGQNGHPQMSPLRGGFNRSTQQTGPNGSSGVSIYESIGSREFAMKLNIGVVTMLISLHQ